MADRGTRLTLRPKEDLPSKQPDKVLLCLTLALALALALTLTLALTLP